MIIKMSLSPSYHPIGLHSQLNVEQLQKLFDVPQKLLTDALAGTVNTQLHARRAVQDRCCKETDGYRLSETSGRRDEDLL